MLIINKGGVVISLMPNSMRDKLYVIKSSYKFANFLIVF
ncbi:hypothetical protein ENHYD8BJ_80177 [Enhydrobacter sp. 8BJ]|nr:hypothetical protein ENHYD8BJ_80177 [Enhydrobacter sp. 8BJ]